jgi:two-component system KDP operon response regulator KdpE
MSDPVTILIIEDNPDIREAASLIFELNWPEAKIIEAGNGVAGLALIKEKKPDLVLLDLGLPDMDGIKVLKEIRGDDGTPVIILTVRSDETDKVRGLEMGADDFIVKPFSHRELLSRVRAVLHRHRNIAASAAKKPEQIQAPVDDSDKARQSASVNIDFANNLVYKGGQAVKLTGTEMNLLKCLAAARGQVLASEQILTMVWGEEYADSTGDLEKYISRLRGKIEEDPAKPKIILKESNGYRFNG